MISIKETAGMGHTHGPLGFQSLRGCQSLQIIEIKDYVVLSRGQDNNHRFYNHTRSLDQITTEPGVISQSDREILISHTQLGDVDPSFD